MNENQQKMTTKYQILELSDTSYKMVVFIVLQMSFEDTCREHRGFGKEPTI